MAAIGADTASEAGAGASATPFAQWRDAMSETAARATVLDAWEGARLRQCLEEIEDVRVKIAFVGHFNAGKSTLLNALIGRAALPTDDLPETGAPCFIHAGVRDSARYIERGVGAEIDCSPAAIRARTALILPDGARRTPPAGAHVELTLAIAPFGADAVWIDTPGLNDEEAASAAAHAVMETADHLVWVTPSRQPFAESERAAIESWLARRGGGAVTLALNAFLENDDAETWRAFSARTIPFVAKRVSAFAAENGASIEMIAGAARAAEAGRASEDDWGVPQLRRRLTEIERTQQPGVRAARLLRVVERRLTPAHMSADARLRGAQAARQRRDSFQSDLEAAIRAHLAPANAAVQHAANHTALSGAPDIAAHQAIEAARIEALGQFNAALARDVSAIAERHGCAARMQDVLAWLTDRLPLPPPARPASKTPAIALAAALIGALAGAAASPGAGALLGGASAFGAAWLVTRRRAAAAKPAWRVTAEAFPGWLAHACGPLAQEILAQCGAMQWSYPAAETVSGWHEVRERLAAHIVEARRLAGVES